MEQKQEALWAIQVKKDNMRLDPREVILRRLCREIVRDGTVALSQGIPQQVSALLPGSVRTFPFSAVGNQTTVDVAVVEAREISSRGEAIVDPTILELTPQADRWIAVTLHTGPDGQARLVRECRGGSILPNRVGLVITELGVIVVNSVGLVLTEVAPGVATDIVRMKTQASLHVADNIRLMEF